MRIQSPACIVSQRVETWLSFAGADFWAFARGFRLFWAKSGFWLFAYEPESVCVNVPTSCSTPRRTGIPNTNVHHVVQLCLDCCFRTLLEQSLHCSGTVVALPLAMRFSICFRSAIFWHWQCILNKIKFEAHTGVRRQGPLGCLGDTPSVPQCGFVSEVCLDTSHSGL